MIYLSAEFYYLCAMATLHPAVFVSDGECVAVCDVGSDRPHACYDANGQPLTDCFDEEHHSQLCDASWYEVTDADYEIVP